MFVKDLSNNEFFYRNMKKKTGRTKFFLQIHIILRVNLRFLKYCWKKFFYLNLRLRVCLAMCLIFQQSEPSVLINRVLIKKECVCKSFLSLSIHSNEICLSGNFQTLHLQVRVANIISNELISQQLIYMIDLSHVGSRPLYFSRCKIFFRSQGASCQCKVIR